MALNSFTVGLQIADLPQFSGPRDLSNTFVLIRRHLNPQTVDAVPRAPISDAGIHRLVQLAYQTSLAEEEGRFPEFKLVNADLDPSDSSSARRSTCVRRSDSLSRPAPAISASTLTLVVEDDAGFAAPASPSPARGRHQDRPPQIVPIDGSLLVVRVLGPAFWIDGRLGTLVLERAGSGRRGLRSGCAGVGALKDSARVIELHSPW